MNVIAEKYNKLVFCRIGSLENDFCDEGGHAEVFCRIGSLEKLVLQLAGEQGVFCRIGSLENIARAVRLNPKCFLPHRQLRN